MQDLWALHSMKKAAHLRETRQMFGQIEDLEKFRRSVERNPETLKQMIKELREQLEETNAWEYIETRSPDRDRRQVSVETESREVPEPQVSKLKTCENFVVCL
mmetsp:Transcript_24064/g.45419  ORF Transcript_24064/g.45419 Transcript_24064/m.45419 type:complete len:103 (-) Transcript_24064:228-536(-)